MISIDEFLKIELKIGTVTECEEIEESEKLLKLKVDLGENAPRQILSGIKQWFKPKDLVGKQFVFVTNLESKTMMGFKSNGMILAADFGKAILVKPVKKVPAGTKIR